MEGAVVPAMLIGAPRMPVPNFFMAAPFWGLQPQVFPPAVYHDQQGAAALNFNS